LELIFAILSQMYPVSKVWGIVAFAPSVMASVIIALSVDYSLFLLTRCVVFSSYISHLAVVSVACPVVVTNLLSLTVELATCICTVCALGAQFPPGDI
jgi:hypothetical protein